MSLFRLLTFIGIVHHCCKLSVSQSCPNVVNSDCQCRDAFACEQESIDMFGEDDIQCDGAKSCLKVSQLLASGEIECHGGWSCQQAIEINAS